MSSASSAVTYTSVYTDSAPGRVFWGADEEVSDGGTPRVIVLGYDGLPMQPVAPPSPDYVPGPSTTPITGYDLILIQMMIQMEDTEEEHADYLTDGDRRDEDEDGGGAPSSEPTLLLYLWLKPLFPRLGIRAYLRLKNLTPTPRAPQIRIPFCPDTTPSKSIRHRAKPISDESCYFASPLYHSTYCTQTDVPEAEMPPRKRACLTTPAPGYETEESSGGWCPQTARGLPQRLDTCDQIVEAMMDIATDHLWSGHQRVT
ncbi:hypothetical protein Tco_1493750 [Tanacetum coccineum]